MLICSFWIAIIVTFFNTAHAAESLETGMSELALQISEKSKKGNKTTVAISAFPHSDGTCSEMSNYIVDELVLSIFTNSNDLQVVERSQLEAVFSEMELGQSGKVELSTAQQLGKVLGVDALVVGSITTLGDKLRIFARLIETETGKVFSGAATTVPRTDTIKELAKKRVSGCAFSQKGKGKKRTQQSSSALTERVEKKDGDLIFRVGSVRQDATKGRITATIEIENVSSKKVLIIYKWGTTSAFDSNSQSYFASIIGGISKCNKTTNHVDYCMREAASLSKGDKAIVTYFFYPEEYFDNNGLKPDKPKLDIKEASALSLSSAFYMWLTNDKEKFVTKSIGFSAVPVDD